MGVSMLFLQLIPVRKIGFKNPDCPAIFRVPIIREKSFLLESQGKSGNFNTRQLPGFTYSSDPGRKVRESQGKMHPKCQGKSGNSNQADRWWQPCLGNDSCIVYVNVT